MVEIEFRGWARVLLVAEDGSGQSLLFFFLNKSFGEDNDKNTINNK